jgi:hypothetical protein
MLAAVQSCAVVPSGWAERQLKIYGCPQIAACSIVGGGYSEGRLFSWRSDVGAEADVSAC